MSENSNIITIETLFSVSPLFMYFALDGTPEAGNVISVLSKFPLWDICSNQGGVDWVTLSGAHPGPGSYEFDYAGTLSDDVTVTCLPGIAATAYCNFSVGSSILFTTYVVRRP